MLKKEIGKYHTWYTSMAILTPNQPATPKQYFHIAGNRGIVQQDMDIELEESTIRTWKARYTEELQKSKQWSTISRTKGRPVVL